MKKILLLIMFAAFSVSAEDQIEWLWKGDKFLERYRKGYEFGLYIKGDSMYYKKLFGDGKPESLGLNDPVRYIEGEFIDLSQRFKYEELKKVYSNLLPNWRPLKTPNSDWEVVRAVVSQVISGEGFLFYVGYGKYQKGPYFLETRNLNGLADDVEVPCVIKRQGTYSYTTVTGATKTVEKYAYGEIHSHMKSEAIEWIRSKYKEEKQEPSK